MFQFGPAMTLLVSSTLPYRTLCRVRPLPGPPRFAFQSSPIEGASTRELALGSDRTLIQGHGHKGDIPMLGLLYEALEASWKGGDGESICSVHPHDFSGQFIYQAKGERYCMFSRGLLSFLFFNAPHRKVCQANLWKDLNETLATKVAIKSIV